MGGDPAYRIDVHDESHLRHLLDDISIAEELAIRHGDQTAGWRLVDTFGIVSRHGGIRNRDAGRLARKRCTATLFSAIESTHGVSAADIDAARPRLQERGIDLPESLRNNFLVLFLLGAFIAAACRRSPASLRSISNC